VRPTFARDIFWAAGAVVAAFIAYSLLGTFGPAALAALNVFSLVVVFFAANRGEIFGAALGSVAGLVQDSFSLGVFGVAGLTKTLLGFWTGYVARRVDIAPPARNAPFLLLISSLELALWVLLNAVTRGDAPNLHGGLLALQPVSTALLGSALLYLQRRFEARSL